MITGASLSAAGSVTSAEPTPRLVENAGSGLT